MNKIIIVIAATFYLLYIGQSTAAYTQNLTVWNKTSYTIGVVRKTGLGYETCAQAFGFNRVGEKDQTIAPGGSLTAPITIFNRSGEDGIWNCKSEPSRYSLGFYEFNTFNSNWVDVLFAQHGNFTCNQLDHRGTIHIGNCSGEAETTSVTLYNGN